MGVLTLEQINCKWAANHACSPSTTLCYNYKLPKQTYCLIDEGKECAARELKRPNQIKLEGEKVG